MQPGFGQLDDGERLYLGLVDLVISFLDLRFRCARCDSKDLYNRKCEYRSDSDDLDRV